MPCVSGQGYNYTGEDYQARSALAGMKKELDTVTAMLCSLLEGLYGNNSAIPPDVAKWYAAHKEWDHQNGRP